jgi:thiol-disulfide isomerase/thioredoxin
MIPSVLLAALALVGCGGETRPPAPPPSRVDVVKAAPVNPDEIKGFCDLYAPEAEAKPFVWPALAAGSAPPVTGWRWVNVWATWCGPCIAEMPMLHQWRDKLAASGKDVTLTFVSFDAGQPEVDRFRDKHPEWALDLRITGTDAIAPWLGQVGLDLGTAIPIHAFVDPSGKLRCVRTGALAEDAYATVARVISGG